MKTTLLVIGSIFTVILVVSLFSGQSFFQQQSASATPQPETTGRLIFQIKDTQVPLDTVSSVEMTIHRARMHHSTKGWIDIVDPNANPQVFDLLKLKSSGDKLILTDTKVPIGTYDEIHLTIDKVAVTETKTGKIVEARLPSQELIINSDTLINGRVSSILMDFMMEESLHSVSTGGYVFAPVFKLNASRDVQIDETNGSLEVTDGTPYIDETYGMDESGETNIGLGIEHTKIEIVNGAILLKDTKENTTNISAGDAVTLAIKSGIVSVISVRMSVYNNLAAWLVTGMRKTGGRVSTYIDSKTGVVLD